MLKIIKNILIKIKSLKKSKMYYYDLEVMPNMFGVVDKD